jgi:hypothetical protein
MCASAPPGSEDLASGVAAVARLLGEGRGRHSEVAARAVKVLKGVSLQPGGRAAVASVAAGPLVDLLMGDSAQ